MCCAFSIDLNSFVKVAFCYIPFIDYVYAITQGSNKGFTVAYNKLSRKHFHVADFMSVWKSFKPSLMKSLDIYDVYLCAYKKMVSFKSNKTHQP